MPRSSSAPRLTRRNVLIGGAATLLAACTQSSDPGSTSTAGVTTNGTALPDADTVITQAIAAAGLQDAAVDLGPQATWPELVVGAPRHLQFVVTNLNDGTPLTDPMRIWLVRDGNVETGPVDATFIADDRIPSGGLHDTTVEVTTPGTVDMVVATADGTRVGTTAMQAINAADSAAPGPGQTLSVVGTTTATTPTVDSPGDLEELCTADPDCTLHDQTLTQALAAGPTVLCIATPKFCSTAICGPVLDDVVSVATSGDHPDVQFVHVEPFTDAGVTPTALVTDLQLPSEPWTFVLEQDGTIVARFPGPVLPRVLDDILADLTA